MKKAFTIYVPDDCHVQMLNICISVQKKDLSTNGITVFTKGENGFDKDGEEWLFNIKGKAKKITLEGEVEE